MIFELGTCKNSDSFIVEALLNNFEFLFFLDAKSLSLFICYSWCLCVALGWFPKQRLKFSFSSLLEFFRWFSDKTHSLMFCTIFFKDGALKLHMHIGAQPVPVNMSRPASTTQKNICTEEFSVRVLQKSRQFWKLQYFRLLSLALHSHILLIPVECS